MKVTALKKLLILLPLILVYPMISSAVDNSKKAGLVSMVFKGTFKNPNGTVTIVMKRIPITSEVFVTKFTVTVGSSQKTCEIIQSPYSKVNTGVSINFATFGWEYAGSKVQGIIGMPNTPYPSNVSWSSISTGDCKVPDKSAVPLSQSISN